MLCKRKAKDPELRKSQEIDLELKYCAEAEKKFTQILLLGTGESGKTTIIKQMKIIHINGFTVEEKKSKIPFIRQNIHESIYTILKNMEKINPPIEIPQDVKTAAECILNLGENKEDPFTEDYYNNVKLLWSNPNVKEAYSRSSEYQLIDSAEYFLNRIDEIKQTNYVPTLEDILYCRVTTTNISKIEFEVPVRKRYGGGSAKFWMYDVGGQRGHRTKWISVFAGIKSVLFLIAASDFDLKLREDESQNRLVESFKLFREMYGSRFLNDAGMIVFLNKQDILQKKIESGKRLQDFFPEYASFQPSADEGIPSNEYEKTKLFMRRKLMDVRTMNKEVVNRELYIHFTTATDTNNIKLVFDSVHQIILESNIKGAGIV